MDTIYLSLIINVCNNIFVCRSVICTQRRREAGRWRHSTVTQWRRTLGSCSWGAKLQEVDRLFLDGHGGIAQELCSATLIWATLLCRRAGMTGEITPSKGNTFSILKYYLCEVLWFLSFFSYEILNLKMNLCCITYRTVFYGEYKCYGPGANRAKRVAWSRSLSADEAAKLFTKDMIGGRGWLRPAPSHFKRSSSTIV